MKPCVPRNVPAAFQFESRVPIYDLVRKGVPNLAHEYMPYIKYKILAVMTFSDWLDYYLIVVVRQSLIALRFR